MGRPISAIVLGAIVAERIAARHARAIHWDTRCHPEPLCTEINLDVLFFDAVDGSSIGT